MLQRRSRWVIGPENWRKALADVRYYEIGYRHLDWDLYTAKEMKTSNKLVKKYGYFHLSFLEHAHRLKVMKELYRRKKMVRLLLRPMRG